MPPLLAWARAKACFCYEHKIGTETVTFYETEFLAAAIERVAVRAESEADE